MTNKEVKAFRSILEQKRDDLENENRKREALAIEASPDEMDQIQSASARDDAMGYLERTSHRFREVQAALDLLNAGTYGICTDCEEDINPKRLMAIPWASTCLVCQEAAERRAESPGREVETSLGRAA